MAVTLEVKLFFLLLCLFFSHISLVRSEIECFKNIDGNSSSGSYCHSESLVKEKFTTASECCLGNGYWFRNLNESGECMQCIGEFWH